MEQTVSEAVEARLTDERTVAHLATCVDGRPHVAPLWFRRRFASFCPVVRISTVPSS